MLRQSVRALARSFHTSSLTCAEEATSKHTSQMFLETWAKANTYAESAHCACVVVESCTYLEVSSGQQAPFNLDAPAFPAESLPKTEIPATIPDKLTFNFFMPHSTEIQNEKVDMVLIPGTDGDFGVLPGHVPTVSQLKPGVMSVHKDDKDVVKYFVSSGFAFIHADSTAEVCAVEAVPLDQIDGNAVKESLAEYNNQLVNAKDDYEKAAAQIGIEVCSAMAAAVGQ